MFDISKITKQYDQLIAALYQGPLENTPWESFLPILGEQLSAFAVSLVLRPPTAGDAGLILNFQRPATGAQSTTSLADPTDWPAAAYREQFFALDPFVNLPIGEVVTLAELLPEHELLSSDYYIHYLEPAGVYHIIGADTREPEGLIASLRISRGRDERPFDESDRGLLAALMPHLKRAIQLHARLSHVESERDLYANAVDKLAMGTVIMDENARVLSNNTVAAMLLSQKDGIKLVNQQLQLGNREQSLEFEQLVNKVLAQHNSSTPSVAEALRVTRPSGRPDLGLIIRPVPTSQWADGQSGPTVAIFISDPEQQPDTSQQIIARLFGFTPAEAALAMLLAKGLTLAQASDTQAVSQHTARAQLKAIFAKTGVTRQAELVSLILKSVANLG